MQSPCAAERLHTSTGASATHAYVHATSPLDWKVPVGQRVKPVAHNQDDTPKEFERHPMNREKVVPGDTKATVYIGPLKARR